MSRYRGPKLKITRKLGNLPGLTQKKSKKTTPPGEHGQKSRKPSEYALRLEEKQKIRFNYGISEKQLVTYVKKAKKAQGPTGSVLLQMLEMRLDNIIFRLGLAPTIPAARQIVNHGHILVNRRKLNICSYQCRPGDIIKAKNTNKTQKLLKEYSQNSANIPSHLEIDTNNLLGKINGIVAREFISLQLNELFVVEYYSRK